MRSSLSISLLYHTFIFPSAKTEFRAKGPRTLDIDILFFGSRHIELISPPLTIPHPAVLQRAFVLVPLLELYPQYIDPVTEQPLAAALALLPDQGVRKSPAQIDPMRE